MQVHKRLFCKECKRERINPTACHVNSNPVFLCGNGEVGRCPWCGSIQVEEVLYTPKFRGGDIPRPAEEIIELPPNADIGDEIVSIPAQRAPGFIANPIIERIIKEQLESESSEEVK